MDKCFSGEWTKIYTSAFCFESKALQWELGGLVAGGGCVLCDSQWSLNHLMLALDFLLPSLTEIIVVFSATQSQLMGCSRPGYCDYARIITPANVGTETEKIVSGLLKYRNVLTGKSKESLLWYKWQMLMPISLFFSINFYEMIDCSAW